MARVITLSSVLCPPSSWPALARLTYTGGYVLPGTTPDPGQTPLPDDLEQAAVEQVTFWFQNRERLGIRTNWPSGGIYQQIVVLDLLPSVQAVLSRYTRLTLWSRPGTQIPEPRKTRLRRAGPHLPLC